MVSNEANGPGDEPGSVDPAPSSVAASLTASVLEEEARRQEEQAALVADVILPNDLLPGVGDDPMSLKEAIRVGGAKMVLFMFLLNLIDDIPRATRVVAPDIQNTFGISDTALTGVLSFGGVALVLGAVPMAAIADRIKRVAIIPIASLFWAVAMFLSGMVANPFQLFITNAFTGAGQAYRIPVSNSLLTDAYPVQARSQIFALEGVGRPLGQLLGPLIVGGTAAAVGGTEGWRWAFFILAIPPVLVGLASITLKEPKRGQFDQQAIFGDGDIDSMTAVEQDEVAVEDRELPINISQAFARLTQVRAFYFLAVGVGVLGFALIAVPLQFNLLMESRYAFGPLKRGVVESLIWVVSIPILPVVGKLFDRKFREDPPAMMRLAGYFVIFAGVIYAIALPIKNIGTLVVMIAIAQAAISAAFVAAAPIIAAVSPFRIRALAFAFLPVFIFLMGGFFGGLLVGSLSDSYGNRTAMWVVAPPAAVIGGLLIVYGSRFIRRDISLAVEEMIEDRDEIERMAEMDPDDVPVIQVRNLDFAYGPVQVLFDVEFEVMKGEVVALLGTNGAGKSTILNVVAGLGTPSRGVVRLNGRAFTYTSAEQRNGLGIHMLAGGKGVFLPMSIDDNLEMAAFPYRNDEGEAERRIARVLELFPELADRGDDIAGSLSGGQQQILALAMTLLHDPEILIIDELSLGLAPVIVERLLAVIEQLKAEGMTMIIVEQSLNVALAIADRAIFLEKGRVRFTGPAAELAERDDLARAVFLGDEGG